MTAWAAPLGAEVSGALIVSASIGAAVRPTFVAGAAYRIRGQSLEHEKQERTEKPAKIAVTMRPFGRDVVAVEAAMVV